MYAIGVDIGGMSAKIGVVCRDRVLEEKRLETGADLPFDTFVKRLAETIGQMRRSYCVDRIGVSSCGLIDRRAGTIVTSNNIRWENKPLAQALSEATGLPVRMANDGKCAALAEAVWGAGKDFDRVCMLTLGTGVGGGFVCGKRLPDASAYGDGDGILGHITLERGGRPCTCGRRGCLEAYASATAIAARYREVTGEEKSVQRIFALAADGQEQARAVVAAFRADLTDGIVSLVNVLRPEIVVIGGGVAGSAALFLPGMEEQVNREIFGGVCLPVKLAAAEMGNQAGILGAALL